MQKSFLSGLFTSPSPLFSIAAEKLPQMAQRLHQHCRLFLRKPLQSRADHFLMKILMMQISPIPPVCKRDQYHPTVVLLLSRLTYPFFTRLLTAIVSVPTVTDRSLATADILRGAA